METKNIRFVYEGGVGEIEEKKSRFIASVAPVHSEDEANAFLAAKKKEYWDARHNCHAFVVGKNSELQRCSDDGEPSGTAGRPILEVLLHENLRDTAVVVTRYFGGTLLGTGGLVRAYQGATQAGLSASKLAERLCGYEIRIDCDYADFSKVERLAIERDLPVADSDYAERVRMTVMSPLAKKEGFLTALIDATSGRAVVEVGDPIEYAVIEKKIVRFS